MAKDVGQYVECPSCGAAVAAPDPDQDRPRYCSQCGTRFSARSGSVSGLLAFLGASGSTSTEEADVPAWPARGPAWDYRLLDVAARFGDRYRIERLLGRGAMGTVYLAWDERLHRHVALKVPHPDLGPELRERFEREARVAARIRHPNICPIHDVAALADGTPYLTMTYIEGQTLAAWSAAHGPLPGREAAVVVLQLARAMAEAHRHLVIHRDLKPTNVMVTPGGTLVIMDFGLAKRLDASETGVTQTKALIGTVAYMSPEQALEDVSAIGPGSDVYSLGVVLYELLTRRRPFEGGILAVLKAIAHAPPPPPSTLRPDIDPRLEAICLKAMAKDRDQRHETMSALARDLETFLAADEDASASNSGGPGLSTARQAFRATLPPESVVVEVPGSWCARPADLPEAEWVEVARVPGTVRPRPGEVYKLAIHPRSTNADLVGLAELRELDLLRGLDLWKCQRLTDSALAAVAELTSLRAVDVGLCPQFTDEALRHLGRLTNLRALNLRGMRELTGTGLVRLRALIDLEALNLRGCDLIGDDGLAALAELPALRALDLRGLRRMTDVGLAQLVQLGRLRTLDLTWCQRITDAGLAKLHDLADLEQVHLGECPWLTESVLEVARAWPRLKFLSLRGCRQIPKAAIERLRADRPDLAVEV